MKKRELTQEQQYHKFSWAETWFLEKLEFKANIVLEIHLTCGKKTTPENLKVLLDSNTLQISSRYVAFNSAKTKPQP